MIFCRRRIPSRGRQTCLPAGRLPWRENLFIIHNSYFIIHLMRLLRSTFLLMNIWDIGCPKDIRCPFLTFDFWFFLRRRTILWKRFLLLSFYSLRITSLVIFIKNCYNICRRLKNEAEKNSLRLRHYLYGDGDSGDGTIRVCGLLPEVPCQWAAADRQRFKSLPAKSCFSLVCRGASPWRR